MNSSWLVTSIISLFVVVPPVLGQATIDVLAPVSGVGELRFFEERASGENYQCIKSPLAVTTSTCLELPDGFPAGDRCLKVTAAGVIQYAAGDCGLAGGGPPGGLDTELQYNNAGAFGGITSTTSDGINITALEALASIAPDNRPFEFFSTGSDRTGATNEGQRDALISLYSNVGTEYNKALLTIDLIQTSNAGTITATGFHCKAFTEPDNGGDTSCVLTVNNGGGPGLTVSKDYTARPTGFTDYSTTTSQPALEVLSNFGSAAIFALTGRGGASARTGQVLYARIDNATGKGIVVEPGDGVFDNRKAYQVADHEINAANLDPRFDVEFDGDTQWLNANYSGFMNTTGGVLKLGRFSTDASGFQIVGVKSRGSRAAPTATVAGDSSLDIAFNFYNSTPAEIQSGVIRGEVIDPTAGSEDLGINFFTMAAGSIASRIFIDGNVELRTNLRVNADSTFDLFTSAVRARWGFADIWNGEEIEITTPAHSGHFTFQQGVVNRLSLRNSSDFEIMRWDQVTATATETLVQSNIFRVRSPDANITLDAVLAAGDSVDDLIRFRFFNSNETDGMQIIWNQAAKEFRIEEEDGTPFFEIDRDNADNILYGVADQLHTLWLFTGDTVDDDVRLGWTDSGGEGYYATWDQSIDQWILENNAGTDLITVTDSLISFLTTLDVAGSAFFGTIGSSGDRVSDVWAVNLNISGTCTGCPGAHPISDAIAPLEDDITGNDLFFQLSALTAARTLTIQNASYTVAGTNIDNNFSFEQTFSSAINAAGDLVTFQGTGLDYELARTSADGFIVAAVGGNDIGHFEEVSSTLNEIRLLANTGATSDVILAMVNSADTNGYRLNYDQSADDLLLQNIGGTVTFFTFDESASRIVFGQDLLPDSDDSWDVGSASLGVRRVYVAGQLHIPTYSTDRTCIANDRWLYHQSGENEIHFCDGTTRKTLGTLSNDE